MSGTCLLENYYGTTSDGHYWQKELYFCVYCGQLWTREDIEWKKVNPGLMVKGTYEETR